VACGQRVDPPVVGEGLLQRLWPPPVSVGKFLPADKGYPGCRVRLAGGLSGAGTAASVPAGQSKLALCRASPQIVLRAASLPVPRHAGRPSAHRQHRQTAVVPSHSAAPGWTGPGAGRGTAAPERTEPGRAGPEGASRPASHAEKGFDQKQK
jgi:hypothetical protein